MNDLFLKSFNTIFYKHFITLDLLKNDYILRVDSLQYFDLIFSFLKDHENCLFKVLTDVFVIDYLGCDKRFVLVYCLLSLKYNTRIYIKLQINELASIPSLTNMYKSACWMEREIWDMNGIFFQSHPDLRRLLTDYGFEGHPLKKDFPLTGFVEVRYDDSQKRVVSESIELAQDYRVFFFKSPWE